MSQSETLLALVIDDEPEVRASLAHLLQRTGWQVVELGDANNLAGSLEKHSPHLVISDVRLPGQSGLDAFEQLSDSVHCPPFIFVSAHGDIDMAVQAMTAGAYTFFEKPYDPKRMLLAARHAGEQERLKRQNQKLQGRLAELSGLERILLGHSDSLNKVRLLIQEFAPTQAPVMVVGSTGTGKGLAAKAIHMLSDRHEKPFVKVDCAVIDEAHFASMMFGTAEVEGYVSAAEGGTLFLDEISELSQSNQAQLLQLIENQLYQRVGRIETLQADVRIISATNLDIESIRAQAILRSDLLYRLNTLSLTMPDLTDRSEDIVLLFNHFTEKFVEAYGIRVAELDARDLTGLMTHNWPGNVRELMHLAERRVLLSRKTPCTVQDAFTGEQTALPGNNKLRPAVANFEKALISKMIIEKSGRMEEVAEELGISRRTLNEKIVKLNLDKQALL